MKLFFSHPENIYFAGSTVDFLSREKIAFFRAENPEIGDNGKELYTKSRLILTDTVHA